MLAAEYINQIKESGSYDDSTIIIMTDHGTGRNAQPIFFMKEPHETHDVMHENNAPITYEELMPTIVELLGEDYSVFGQSFHEFKQDEVRHRVFYDRTYDTEYPDVKRYDGMQGGANIYYKYEFDGNLGAIQYQYDNELHEIFRFADGSTIRLNGTKHFENGNCFLLQRLRYCYNRFHQRYTAKQP